MADDRSQTSGEASRAQGRRRRCAPRAFSEGAQRPSWVLVSFMRIGLAYVLAGVAAAIAEAVSGREWLHWLALHLVLLGGVSQLVIGVGQFFACAFLATDPPPRGLIRAQLATWNVGTVAVAVGVTASIHVLVDGGAALVAAGLACFAAALVGMRRRSLQTAPWALRWYLASAACLAVGALAGAMMAGDVSWPYGSLLGAHLALNLGGWLGTAIVGTLHTFFPSLTQTRLRFPRLQLPTFALWLAGVVEIAAGAAFSGRLLFVVGWLDLVAATLLVAVNVLASLRRAARPLALPARLVALAQGFAVAGLSVALVGALRDGLAGPYAGSLGGVLATLLLGGWIGLTVAGSLVHLLAVLARVRSFATSMPKVHPRRELVLTLTAGSAVVLLALAHARALAGLQEPARALTLATATVLGLRVLGLAAQAVRPAAGPERRRLRS